jgi:hypothetical protein
MLRINLLPPYIYEGAKRRNVTILWVVILLAVIGGFVYAKMGIDGETAEWKRKEAEITDKANQADQMAAQAATIRNESAAVRGKAQFVNSAKEYNTTVFQGVLTNIARYTWPRVLYDGVTPEGATVTLPAYAPSLADVGHYMIYMERNPEISRVDVEIGSIPGFPSGGGQGNNQQQPTGVRPLTGGGHNFRSVLTLVKPIAGPPSYSGGGGQTGGGQTGGGQTGGGPMLGGGGFGGGGGMSGGGGGGGGMSGGGGGGGMSGGGGGGGMSGGGGGGGMSGGGR